jgi:hypothetical protein
MTTRQRRRRESRRRKHSETSPTRRRLIAAGGLTAGATLAMAGSAQAATQYTVGTLADDGSAATDCTNAANVDCTLRRAVELADLDSAADTVVFRSGLSGTINLNPGGHIEINEPLNIQGPGASKVTLYGEDTTRLFYVNPNTKYDPVTISGLTLTHGYVMSEGGGAISSNYADLTIANAVISENEVGAGQKGGGIYSLNGSLTIKSSTVTGNDSSQNGGGIGSRYADVSVKDSTVGGNYAGAYGGGIYTGVADLTVSRSTLTGNDASQDGGATYSTTDSTAPVAVMVERSTVSGNHALLDDGGGVWVCCGTDGATLTVVGSTITGNTAATYGGGLNAYLEDPVVEDSIVSGNTATPAASSDLHETYVSGYFQTAFSLIGIPGGYVEAAVPLSNLFGVNPQLGALANNGGPTLTRLPATTSPVVNKGKSFGLTTDQRGLTRPVAFPGVANSAAAGADGADIGAVELQFTPPPAGPTTTPPATPPTTHKKKCKKKKHKRSADTAKKKKCKKKRRSELTRPL